MITPLPFVWPYAIAFWAGVIWAFAPEFAIIRHGRRSASAADAKSLQVIMVGQGVASIISFPIAWLPALQFSLTHRVFVFYAGVALIVGGSLLRRHCFRLLGTSFTGDVRASTDQQVVTRGAYAVLRHPSYTAGILMQTGIGVALGSWASAALMGGASVVVYLYRMNVEERALLAAIGEPYRRFISTRKRLIPFVY